jgi:hypothetical protein
MEKVIDDHTALCPVNTSLMRGQTTLQHGQMSLGVSSDQGGHFIHSRLRGRDHQGLYGFGRIPAVDKMGKR